MKRSHGPALRKSIIDLAQCPECCGRVVIKSVFYQLLCDHGSASGWLAAAGGSNYTGD